jgi:hypothetical protein
MNGKIKQRVCAKCCMKLGKSATETLEMFREAFAQHSLRRTEVSEWHSRFKAGRVLVENENVQGDQTPAK